MEPELVLSPKIPDRLIQASQARQEKLKLKKEQRERELEEKARQELAEKKREGGAQRKAPSKCVVEVEKMRQKREQRRAAMEEVKIEKKELQEKFAGRDVEFELLLNNARKEVIESSPARIVGSFDDSRVTVCVRNRPMSQKEMSNLDLNVVTCHGKHQVIIHEPGVKVDMKKVVDNDEFIFDRVFDESSTNRDIFDSVLAPLVGHVTMGGRASCFCYGQTGSGKTYTINGSGPKNPGLLAQAVAGIFKKAPPETEVYVSLYEIYGPKILDLLNSKNRVSVLEDGNGEVQIFGLTQTRCTSSEDAHRVLAAGMKARTSGVTAANAHSSRSHAIAAITLSKKGHVLNNQAQKDRDPKKRLLSVWGMLSLIDLAGSERGADRGAADRGTRIEGAEINKSLLALKECIRALDGVAGYTPFRASKLTLVLKDSFIGEKTKTLMIANISASSSSCEHTLNTLRYAARVKDVPILSDEYATQHPESHYVPQSPALSDRSDGETDMDPMDDFDGGSPPEGLPQSQDNAVFGIANGNNKENWNEDLECLRNTKGFRSQKEAKFHAAVQRLLDAEESLVSKHIHVCADQQKLLEEEMQLLEVLNSGSGYDVDAYATRLQEILTAKRESIAQVQAKLDHFVRLLKTEEKASQNMQKRHD